MSNSAFDGGVSDRLEGSTEMVGGLMIKKGNSKHKFERPAKGSLLGLQELAEEKRKEKEELLRDDAKKSKLSVVGSNSEDWEYDNDQDNDKSKALFTSSNRDNKDKSRHYRTHIEDTPSHTGGVSNEAREKQLRRMERDRERRGQGVYAETKERKEKNRNRDRDRYDRRGDRGRYGDRSDRSERSQRSREPRSRRNEWEDTPSRSSRSTDRDDCTPQHRSKGNFIRIYLCTGYI
jgi:pre-mRNA-splicing factor ATP-dependent RNA helicase DHX38/PRP16